MKRKILQIKSPQITKQSDRANQKFKIFLYVLIWVERTNKNVFKCLNFLRFFNRESLIFQMKLTVRPLGWSSRAFGTPLDQCIYMHHWPVKLSLGKEIWANFHSDLHTSNSRY